MFFAVAPHHAIVAFATYFDHQYAFYEFAVAHFCPIILSQKRTILGHACSFSRSLCTVHAQFAVVCVIRSKQQQASTFVIS